MDSEPSVPSLEHNGAFREPKLRSASGLWLFLGVGRFALYLVS